jgi:hypothetical protein
MGNCRGRFQQNRTYDKSYYPNDEPIYHFRAAVGYLKSGNISSNVQIQIAPIKYAYEIAFVPSRPYYFH